VPIIRRNNCVFATLGTCYSVWMTVSYGGWNPSRIPDSHTHRITNIKCRKNTVLSPDDGPIVARNIWRLTNILRTNCAPSWVYLQDYTEMHGQRNIKFPSIKFNLCFFSGSHANIRGQTDGRTN
jgi:hypothetical protein